jgi:hypothetical protein
MLVAPGGLAPLIGGYAALAAVGLGLALWYARVFYPQPDAATLSKLALQFASAVRASDPAAAQAAVSVAELLTLPRFRAITRLRIAAGTLVSTQLALGAVLSVLSAGSWVALVWVALSGCNVGMMVLDEAVQTQEQLDDLSMISGDAVQRLLPGSAQLSDWRAADVWWPVAFQGAALAAAALAATVA